MVRFWLVWHSFIYPGLLGLHPGLDKVNIYTYIHTVIICKDYFEHWKNTMLITIPLFYKIIQFYERNFWLIQYNCIWIIFIIIIIFFRSYSLQRFSFKTECICVGILSYIHVGSIWWYSWDHRINRIIWIHFLFCHSLIFICKLNTSFSWFGTIMWMWPIILSHEL